MFLWERSNFFSFYTKVKVFYNPNLILLSNQKKYFLSKYIKTVEKRKCTFQNIFNKSFKKSFYLAQRHNYY